MRFAGAAFGMLIVACSASDPDWSLPCSEQPKASLDVGSGPTSFLPLGTAGLQIEEDGGTYAWLGVSVVGLGPDITVSGGVKSATGATLATLPSQSIGLTYDQGTSRDEAAGLVAPFDDPSGVSELVGSTITVFASATGCGHTVEGSVVTTLSGYDTTTCQGCLADACLPELDACGADCISIQACLDAYCANLSANASPDEVTCQAYCELQYPSGKEALIDLVSCVQASTCQPPCNGYSIDYDACVAEVTTGPNVNLTSCSEELSACTMSAACQAFKTCTASCTSFMTCEACGAGNAEGATLYEAYNDCVETTCLTVGWLPHLSE